MAAERRVTVINRLGLHARPAAEFVKTASKFEAEIKLSKDTMEVNGKSILGVMTLAAECGSELVVRAEGADADAAVDALAEVLGRDFGNI
ncbi:MAG: HPr family phosphocarrier protein [Gemmatimonadales bacterium]